MELSESGFTGFNDFQDNKECKSEDADYLCFLNRGFSRVFLFIVAQFIASFSESRIFTDDVDYLLSESRIIADDADYADFVLCASKIYFHETGSMADLVA